MKYYTVFEEIMIPGVMCDKVYSGVVCLDEKQATKLLNIRKNMQIDRYKERFKSTLTDLKFTEEVVKPNKTLKLTVENKSYSFKTDIFFYVVPLTEFQDPDDTKEEPKE